MDLRLLRYFIAVAEGRHFSKAAQRLYISQPPLSYAIRQLEEALGAKLLERISRHVALTLSRKAEDTRTLVQRVDAGLRGWIRIGFVGSMLYRGLPTLLRTLRQELPDVYEMVLAMCTHAGFSPVVCHEVRHWLSVASLVSQNMEMSIVPECVSCSGLAGTRFVAFEHEARSVSQLIWRRDEQAPLLKTVRQAVGRQYGVANEGG